MENSMTSDSVLPSRLPDNLQPWMVTIHFIVLALATMALLLRLASRRIRHQRLWLDDYMIIFSLVWLYAFQLINFGLFYQGVGLHASLLSPAKIVLAAKWLIACSIFYVWNLCWTKLAVLLMYYRIFDSAPFRRFAWFVASLVIAWAALATLLFVFICVPVQKLWYPDIPGHCIDQVSTWVANAVSTILTDLVILLMPITRIWRLQLRVSEKLGLTLVMGLGCFVIGASTYRLFILFTYNRADSTYTLAPTISWSVIEMAAGIISACLPTLLPVVRYCASRCKLRCGRGAPPTSSSAIVNGPGSAGNGNGNMAVGQQSTRTPSGNLFWRLSDGDRHGSFQIESHAHIGHDGPSHGNTCIELHDMPTDPKA